MTMRKPKVLMFQEWLDKNQDAVDERIEECELCGFEAALCPECFDEFRREYKATREREKAAWKEWHKGLGPASSAATPGQGGGRVNENF